MTFEQNFSLKASTIKFLKDVLRQCQHLLPQEIHDAIARVDIIGQDSALPLLPCPFRETEAITSLKVIEAAYALTLLQQRTGSAESRAQVDLNHATAFLFLAFQSSIDGLSKQHPEHYSRLLDTDLHQSQSNVYRLAMTNIFKTRDGYFQFHGGLNASLTLKYLGLDERRPDMIDYTACCALIEQRTVRYTNAELVLLCQSARQAGSPVYSRKEYLQTEQGMAESSSDWMQCSVLEHTSPACPLNGPLLLSGVRVLDLTRVIAGPLIGRTLAEYGADVLRVHNVHLPDVPYYQVDLNYGKRATHIDLKSKIGLLTFANLLEEADVIIDGYRPGVLKRLGFGPEAISQKLSSRKRGFVYLSENCHGWKGPLSSESGWQQIADASCGMSAAQGVFWRKDEPIAPPFPMADFGTGEMGAIAILHALYLRSVRGGSYHMKVSLCNFNNFVMQAGQYDSHIQNSLYNAFREDFEAGKIGHASNFNKVGKAALDTMRRISPQLWSPEFMTESQSACFGPASKGSSTTGAKICTQRGVVNCSGKCTAFLRSTRYNGFDESAWEPFDRDIFVKS